MLLVLFVVAKLIMFCDGVSHCVGFVYYHHKEESHMPLIFFTTNCVSFFQQSIPSFHGAFYYSNLARHWMSVNECLTSISNWIMNFTLMYWIWLLYFKLVSNVFFGWYVIFNFLFVSFSQDDNHEVVITVLKIVQTCLELFYLTCIWK